MGLGLRVLTWRSLLQILIYFPHFRASVFRFVRRRLFLCQFCCLFVSLLLLMLSVSFSCFPIYFSCFPTYLKKGGLHDVIGSSTFSLS